MEQFLGITITSTVTALVILLFKTLLSKKISPKWQLYIWAILAIRLIIPALPQSAVSLFNQAPTIQNVELSQTPRQSIVAETGTYVVGEIVLADQTKPFTLSRPLYDCFIAIWVIGMAALLLYLALVYLVFNKKTKCYSVINDKEILLLLEKCKNRMGLTDNIIVRRGGSTPLLKGVFRPEIILPDGYTLSELESVFTHELMHLKYFDIPVLMLCTLLLCVYWYNPVLWLCFFVLRRDIEVLCDCRVLEVLSDRKQYASVLLKTALRKNSFLFATTSMQNGEKQISRRIKFIAYYKKPKALWSTVAILAALIIGTLCLTNAQESSAKDINGYNAAAVYGFKTSYVGDASKVGGITSNLHYAQYKNGISLETKSQPYGLTVNYIVSPEEFSGISSDGNHMLIKNAAVLFCLIDNVDTVRFKIEDGSNIYTYTFDRATLANAFGHDFREYSSSLIKFRDDLLPALAMADWKGAESNITPVSIPKNVLLYVWRNKKLTGSNDIYFTLLPDTGTTKTDEMIYDLKNATADVNEINEKLKAYEGDTDLSVLHDISFSKDEMLAIRDTIKFSGTTSSIGAIVVKDTSEIAKNMEAKLEIIMSSPKEFSNPRAYIEAHWREYEEILKMGDDALNYMLSEFDKGKAQGLKAHIMMSLCKEFLGDRNNVEEGTYSSPQEWYQKLAPYTAKKLSAFAPNAKDKTEELVYQAALSKYGNPSSMTIVAPHIFGTYETGNEFRIFATVYYSGYNLYGTNLSQGSTGIVPAAIIYTKNQDGTYALRDYIEAKDGSYFQSSIEEFCAPRADIAKAIAKHYGNYDDLMVLMKKNIILCLKQNNLTGISLKEYNGTLTPLT